MSNIVLQNINKSFDGKPVLQDFSHTFEQGGFTCVMGASGGGKTTLLNIIAGLLAQDSGTCTGVPQKIGMVFQEHRLCESFSALANLQLVCGSKLSQRELLQHLAAVGLADSADAAAATLSGGMKQRLAIARAVAYDADLLLLDEPLKELDNASRALSMDYIRHHAAGKTVIMSTHDADEAHYLGGEILQLGHSLPQQG